MKNFVTKTMYASLPGKGWDAKITLNRPLQIVYIRQSQNCFALWKGVQGKGLREQADYNSITLLFLQSQSLHNPFSGFWDDPLPQEHYWIIDLPWTVKKQPWSQSYPIQKRNILFAPTTFMFLTHIIWICLDICNKCEKETFKNIKTSFSMWELVPWMSFLSFMLYWNE